MARRKEHHEVQLAGTLKPRNLLVFMDGTWNDENGRSNDGAVTNIYKLFSSLSGSHEHEQIPHVKSTAKHLGLYFRGIGNDEANVQAIGFYQAAFGAGEKSIRDHAYASICKHYRPGDRISIFGFSRGAASARMLATKLHKYGLPAEITLHYRSMTNQSSGEKEWQFSHYDTKDEGSGKVDVAFMGLLDTVGAFGIPINIGPLNFQKVNLFHDLTLSPNVKRAVHLVGIDESREPFIPTLTNISDRIDEVWLPGVHSDIGGGFHDGMLGNVAMDYLVGKFQQEMHDMPVTFTRNLEKWTQYDLDSDKFVMHYHGDGFKKTARKMEVLKKQKSTTEPVKVHHSVFKLREQDNFFYSERYNSFATRVPIKYDPINLKDLGSNIIHMP
ncbi:MAG: DUF2235 domain-containing protein [Gammaproteobacteria bacterium]